MSNDRRFVLITPQGAAGILHGKQRWTKITLLYGDLRLKNSRQIIWYLNYLENLNYFGSLGSTLYSVLISVI